jgi:hypothetical protein
MADRHNATAMMADANLMNFAPIITDDLKALSPPKLAATLMAGPGEVTPYLCASILRADHFQ